MQSGHRSTVTEGVEVHCEQLVVVGSVVLLMAMVDAGEQKAHFVGLVAEVEGELQPLEALLVEFWEVTAEEETQLNLDLAEVVGPILD